MNILSFIVPAYNAAPFLDTVLPSLLCEEVLDKLEVIVVNDGSADQTASIAQGYCDRYPGTVRLISQENKGHGGALNTGCAAATGKYLKIIDADDWIQTQNLPAFLTFLETCASDVVLTHHRTLDITTGEIQNWKSFPREFGRAYDFSEIMADWNSFSRSLTFHGITYRTAFYREQGIALSEHVFYEDYEYATFPCCHAATVTPLDLFLYEYRIGDVAQSVSDESRVKRIGHMETVLHRLMAEYGALSGDNTQGKAYAAMKIQEFLLSYLTVALLIHPDRILGRTLAKRQVAACRKAVPEAYNTMKWKYPLFSLMNRLHITRQAWERMLHSEVYRLLRKRKRFD